jgi:ABC-type sugar transport system substrate-binding protein
MTMNRSSWRRGAALTSVFAIASLGLAACGDGGSEAGGDGNAVGVSLIVKTTTNPFFVAMQEGAKAAAAEHGVELTMAAGKADGDEDTQIQAIENAISRGDDGILITLNGPGVEDALIRARDAGLYVIVLDTPPSDPEAGDITFATDNLAAGQRIGEWAAAQLGGEPPAEQACPAAPCGTERGGGLNDGALRSAAQGRPGDPGRHRTQDRARPRPLPAGPRRAPQRGLRVPVPQPKLPR